MELHHGDQISLLPDSLRYRVELETSEGGEPGTSSQQRSQGEGEKVDGPTAEEKWKRETAPAASTGRRRVLPPWLCGLTSTISPPQATPSRARAPGKAQVKRTRPPSPSPDNDRQHPRPGLELLKPPNMAGSFTFHLSPLRDRCLGPPASGCLTRPAPPSLSLWSHLLQVPSLSVTGLCSI